MGMVSAGRKAAQHWLVTQPNEPARTLFFGNQFYDITIAPTLPVRAAKSELCCQISQGFGIVKAISFACMWDKDMVIRRVW